MGEESGFYTSPGLAAWVADIAGGRFRREFVVSCRERGPCLNTLIGFFESLLVTHGLVYENPGKPPLNSSDGPESATNSWLFKRLNGHLYARIACLENDLTAEDKVPSAIDIRKRQWDDTCDLLRYLRAYKEGVDFLLPERDRVNAEDFLTLLSHN